MDIEIDCPICNDGKKHKAEVLEERKGKFKRKRAEFDAEVFIVRCRDCGTIGMYKVVKQANLEFYYFPYEEGEV
ncbi:MAG: hypothetical protein DRO98_04460 [Archaeoglobales archaeon]|nr:MAG: hypothetical protein DRO98_04460 [Archaeoglobales archaeon]